MFGLTTKTDEMYQSIDQSICLPPNWLNIIQIRVSKM